jgi:hypothetical protein
MVAARGVWRPSEHTGLLERPPGAAYRKLRVDRGYFNGGLPGLHCPFPLPALPPICPGAHLL